MLVNENWKDPDGKGFERGEDGVYRYDGVIATHGDEDFLFVDSAYGDASFHVGGLRSGGTLWIHPNVKRLEADGEIVAKGDVFSRAGSLVSTGVSSLSGKIDVTGAETKLPPLSESDFDPEGLSMALDNARKGATHHVFTRESGEDEPFVLDMSVKGDDARQRAESYGRLMGDSGRDVATLTTAQLHVLADSEDNLEAGEDPEPGM